MAALLTTLATEHPILQLIGLGIKIGNPLLMVLMVVSQMITKVDLKLMVSLLQIQDIIIGTTYLKIDLILFTWRLINPVQV